MTSKKLPADLIAEINKQFGKGTLTKASDPYYKVTHLPTGIAPIDDLLHGGIPFGRFVEIFGDYSTLKSYIGYCAIAQAQKRGLLAALVDAEHSFDPEWAASLGVDLDALEISRPETGEEAMDVAEILIRGKVDLIVFDSVAAALPKAEHEKSLSKDKQQPARLAQLMSAAMRKLTAANGKTAVLWINQTRINVGVMFGSNEAVPGGKSLPFYASYRIAVRKTGSVFEEAKRHEIKDSRVVIVSKKRKVGQLITATVEKSKLSAPHEAIQFTFDFKTGRVDEWSYLANKGLDKGVLGLDRGKWWEVQNPSVKLGGEAAGEVWTTEHLIELLAEKPSSGTPRKVVKSKAVKPSSASSKRVVRKSIPTAEQAASSSTGQTRKRLSK